MGSIILLRHLAWRRTMARQEGPDHRRTPHLVATPAPRRRLAAARPALLLKTAFRRVG